MTLRFPQGFGSGQAVVFLYSRKKRLLRLRLAMTPGVEGEDHDRESHCRIEGEEIPG